MPDWVGLAKREAIYRDVFNRKVKKIQTELGELDGISSRACEWIPDAQQRTSRNNKRPFAEISFSVSDNFSKQVDQHGKLIKKNFSHSAASNLIFNSSSLSLKPIHH